MKYTMTLASVCSAICLVFIAPVFADDEEEPFFEEAFIFFELNDTDGDLGIHAKIDGDPYKRLKIVCEKKLLDLKVKGSLRKQGLTELFFESAEPDFEELSAEEFFERFPEGDCEIKGTTLDGEKVETETTITHLMPAPPVTFVNTDEAAEDCDVEPLPAYPGDMPIVISWEEVTDSHPDLGSSGELEVINYEVVVEIDEEPFHVSIILPPDARSFVVPPEMIALLGEEFGDELKFEVLVREASYNQTAVESCFVVE